MNELGKWLIVTGAGIAVFGLILLAAGKLVPFGRLPGDVTIEQKNYTVYFPIATCIILSIFISLVVWIVSKIR